MCPTHKGIVRTRQLLAPWRRVKAGSGPCSERDGRPRTVASPSWRRECDAGHLPAHLRSPQDASATPGSSAGAVIGEEGAAVGGGSWKGSDMSTQARSPHRRAALQTRFNETATSTREPVLNPPSPTGSPAHGSPVSGLQLPPFSTGMTNTRRPSHEGILAAGLRTSSTLEKAPRAAFPPCCFAKCEEVAQGRILWLPRALVCLPST